MARIQILELPEGADDTRPPFVLVIDEYQPTRYVLGAGDEQAPPLNPFDGMAEQVGARTVLVFEESIEIPANQIEVDGQSYPLTVKVEGDFAVFREQVEAEIAKAASTARRRINDALT